MALPFYTAWKTVSSTSSEYWKDNFQALVDAEFDNSPTIKTVLHNGTSVVVRVVGKFNTETLARNNDDYQKIIFKDSSYTVNVGDLFVFDSLTWICTNISSTTVSKSCSVQLCNNTLSFYSTTDSTLHSIPCIIGNRVNLKTDENKYISTASNELYLTISNTSINRQIQVGDIFSIGVSSYKISTICDDISVVGLLTFKIEYSEEVQVAHTYTVVIQNSDAIKHIDDTLTLDIVCTDNSETVSSPTLTYQSSDTDVVTVSTSGVITCIAEGTAIITVSFNSISDTLNLTVQSEVIPDDYTILVDGASTVKLNSNITLTSTVFNNGVVDESESVTWTFNNQDLSSNIYATLVSSTGSSITLKATSNNAYVNKYVVVRGTKSDDALVYDEHLVQIKSLF